MFDSAETPADAVFRWIRPVSGWLPLKRTAALYASADAWVVSTRRKPAPKVVLVPFGFELPPM